MPIPSEIMEELPAKLTALGLSSADLCKLIEWSAPQLSNFLAGRRLGMGIEEMNRVYSVVLELERLSEMVKPIPIDFRRTDSVRALLSEFRAGHLSYYTSDENINSARFRIVIEAIDAAQKEVQRAAAVSALIEGRV